MIDYALCTIEMFQYISEFKVHDLNEWSDHCLLSLSIDSFNGILIKRKNILKAL